MAHRAVSIEKLAFGGAGFGREEGKACFVPYTAPGDTVEIEVAHEKKSYVEGRILRVIHPSGLRIHPECPQFTLCGGCNWQHLPYNVQLSQKQNIFEEMLSRSGIVTERILPIIPAPTPYFYRSRLQFKVRIIEGKVNLGFYRSGSHFVIDIGNCCPLASNALNILLGQLRELLAALPQNDMVPQVDVSTGDNDNAIVIIHFIGNDFPLFAQKVQTLAAFPPGTGIFVQQGRKNTLQKIAGHGALSYIIPAGLVTDMPEIRLSFSRGGFSQVNFSQNLQLIRLACEWAGLSGKERVLDLYCGNGNLAIPLSCFSSSVTGIETYGPSIDDAWENAKANNRHNVKFTCGDAALQLKRLATDREKFDIVVLDPPRSGAAEVTDLIPRLEPETIIYVSCDPATLARDLGAFRKHSYEVIRTQPVDMFPQTYHIESVTLLKRMH